MNGDYSKLHNSEAEYMVIGACITNPDIYFSIQERLRTQLFTEYDCRKAIIIIHQMVEQGKQPDMTEVTPLLAKEAVDIARFLTLDCVSFEVTKQRLNLLEDLYVRRKVYEICSKGEALTSDPTVQTEDLQVLVKEFDSVLNDSDGSDVQSFGSVVGGLMNDVALRMNGKEEKGMLTGLHIFDSRYGFHSGDLVIIAGETSQGKSTLATTIAYNMACVGIGSAYYSLEMSAKQLVARIMASKTKVSSSRTLYDKLNEKEYQQVYDSTLQMKGLPIYFDENCKTSFTRICASIKKMVKMYGIKVAFIDYLQILANGKGDNREQLLGDMARDLKRLAVELGICVIALSQMSRAAGGKEGQPALSRMRGSGQIEEACDIAILVHRPNKQRDEARLYIAKHRNGALAEERVRFNSVLSYFSDYEQGEPQAGYQEHNEQLPF